MQKISGRVNIYYHKFDAIQLLVLMILDDIIDDSIRCQALILGNVLRFEFLQW